MIPTNELTKTAREMRTYSDELLEVQELETKSAFVSVFTLIYEDKVYVQFWANGQCYRIQGPFEMTREAWYNMDQLR